jgi:CheY-like chemotaxis protein
MNANYQQLNVLIVADKDHLAKDLSERLIAMGHRVAATMDKAEAVMDLADTPRPDLVLIHAARDADKQHQAEAARVIFDHLAIPTLFIVKDATDLAGPTAPIAYIREPFHDNVLADAMHSLVHVMEWERERRRATQELPEYQKEQRAVGDSPPDNTNSGDAEGKGGTASDHVRGIPGCRYSGGPGNRPY